MAKQVSRILSIAFFLGWSVVPALSQNRLSAKVNKYQPQPAAVSGDSDRTRDGLNGPVRRVRTEVVKVTSTGGNIVEGDKRVLLETAEYDIKGTKTQNQYFPIAGATLTGREVYKYDEKGNISEMTLLGTNGSLISKEVYKYEFDSVGNWTKMTTSVAVVENEKMARMLEPAQPSSSNTQPAPDTSKPAEPKNQPANTAGNTVSNPSSKRGAASKRSAAVLETPVSFDKTKLALNQQVPIDTRNPAVNDKSIVVLENEAPPTNEPKPILKPVSRGVLNGSAMSLPSPSYPEVARRMRTTGVVVVEVVIDEDGKVISANSVSGPSMLRDVAVQAALRARFSPTKLSGQPVKVTGTINYNFTLSQ